MIDERGVLLEERLSVYLMLLKITPNLKGYTYMKECAKQIFVDSTKKFNIQEKLYKDVGEMYNEKSTIIERSLRHAIDASLNRDGIKDFEKFMKMEFYNEKPSPRELLCVLVERAMVESNKMLANKSNIYKRWNELLLK